MPNLAEGSNRKLDMLPDEDDVKGAAYGIVRLWSLYR